MGNGISLNSGVSGFTELKTDLRLANMISNEVNLLLKDTANLMGSQYMQYAGSINGLGTDTIRLRRAGLDGFDVMEELAGSDEASDATTQTLTDEKTDLVVSRLALLYKQTDLAALTAYGSDIDPFRLAQSMVGSYAATFAKKTGEAIDDFSAIVGNSTDQMSVDVFFNAIFELEKASSNRGAEAPFACILHPVQITQLQDSLRNETGNAISYMASTAEMLKAKGEFFVGSLLGVDVFKSSHVTNAGGAHQGAMFGKSALFYADGVPASLPGAADVMNMGKIVVEMHREASKAVTSIIGHGYLGISIGQDARGVVIKSTT